MKNIHAVSLEDLISDLATVKGLSAAKQATLILLWHERNDFDKEMTAKQLVEVMYAHGLGRPRSDRLAAQMRGLRVTMSGTGVGSFRVLIGQAAKVGGWVGYEVGSPAAATKPPTARRPSKKKKGASNSGAKRKSSDAARASLFIASSVEGLPIARAIQNNLEHDCDATIWTQGVFGLSTNTLDELIRTAHASDFGVAVLSADDEVTTRGAKAMVARDNCIFELALFFGAIGRERTFFVQDKAVKTPTDLSGITPAKYTARADGNWEGALGTASNKIRDAMAKVGPRTK